MLLLPAQFVLKLLPIDNSAALRGDICVQLQSERLLRKLAFSI